MPFFTLFHWKSSSFPFSHSFSFMLSNGNNGDNRFITVFSYTYIRGQCKINYGWSYIYFNFPHAFYSTVTPINVDIRGKWATQTLDNEWSLKWGCNYIQRELYSYLYYIICIQFYVELWIHIRFPFLLYYILFHSCDRDFCSILHKLELLLFFLVVNLFQLCFILTSGKKVL